MHALEGGAERGRHAAGKHGLANAGNVLNEEVAAAQDGNESELRRGALAHNDPLNILQRLVDDFPRTVNSGCHVPPPALMPSLA